MTQPMIWCGIFLGLFLLNTHLFLAQSRASIDPQTSVAITEPLPVPTLQNMLGDDSLWQGYHDKDPNLVDNWQPLSAKVIFVLDVEGEPYLLVSVKRVEKNPDSKKDSKWEFPGGQIEPGESVLEGLSRELKEEDETLTLHENFMTAKIAEELVYRNIAIKGEEHHTIFKARLTAEAWALLEEKYIPNSEVYRFKLIALKKLDIEAKKNRKKWTPKTRKILAALRGLEEKD